MRLITIPMSHYCEKARWGLTHAGVDYVEEAHLQVMHYWAVRRYSRQGMVPVLVDGTTAIADSTAILQYLDHQLPNNQKLYPAQLQHEVESFEERFDEQLGVATRRWVYFHWMGLPAKVVLKTAGQGTPLWQRSLAPLLMPLLRRFLNRKLGITRVNVDADRQTILAIFDDVATRLSDGRPYLCGSQFTAADLTFACMAAPILLPPEYGIRLPSLEEAPAHAVPDIEQLRAHPAGQFALRLFRRRTQSAARSRQT
ncbi:MAG: glutathione S-transferase [Pseudomonadota bacterium]|nr:glutathione S-transferase [Pseudomonadota bacterium]